MVISSINNTQSQSVDPFGSFEDSSNLDVSSVISHNKPKNEQSKVIKTPKILINNIANGQLALKTTKKIIKIPEPEPSNPFRLSYATLGTPEFEHASKISMSKPSYENNSSDDQMRNACIDTSIQFVRRMPCAFLKEEPLPPIFSIFD